MTSTRLAILRHGPTEWNETGRVQGLSDIPLSRTGAAQVLQWRLPEEMADWPTLVSPLIRARETAHLLGRADARIERRLREMHWGEWEGRRLQDLRAEYGDLMAAWEARGLEFRAEGGESPREVQWRLRPLLLELALKQRSAVAVAHRGVIRALYALATGWTMTGKPPHRMNEASVHVFRLARDGRPIVDQLNIPLSRSDPRD